MQIVKFEALEPRFGEIEVEGKNMSREDIIKLIEQTHPELSDITIMEIVNG